MILMVLVNKFGGLLLIIGNKSEYVVGYVIIYGDMCGGYVLLKDLYKIEVFGLFKWCNIVGGVLVILLVVISCLLLVELCEN